MYSEHAVELDTEGSRPLKKQNHPCSQVGVTRRMSGVIQTLNLHTAQLS